MTLAVEGKCHVCKEWVSLNKPKRRHCVTLKTIDDALETLLEYTTQMVSPPELLKQSPPVVTASFCANGELIVPSGIPTPTKCCREEAEALLHGNNPQCSWFRHAHKCHPAETPETNPL